MPNHPVPHFNKPVNAQRLTDAHAAAQLYRDLLKEKADLEERLRTVNSQLKNYMHERLPDLMDMAGIDRIGLPAQGNSAACDLTLTPFYSANIASNWSSEQRQAAFTALTEFGHENLIKTEITVELPRHERALAARILRSLERFPVSTTVHETVHHKTLTAWLKEQFEGRRPLPPLDVIGASVGRVVNLKERK